MLQEEGKNNTEPTIGIIILAAGSSTRMGQSKQLLSIEGEPLILRSVKAAIETQLKKIVVVLGSREEQHRAVIQNMPLDIIYNKAWQKGMGSSIKAGLDKLLTNNILCEAVIILVCDQPLLTTRHIQLLIEKYQHSKKPIVASRYSESDGVPALFSKHYFPVLLAMDDRFGAKKIIQEYQADVETILFPEGQIDLDTMEDYYTFIQNKA
jgi:molybdenum cofactor cytidylyltransferase